MKICFIVDYYPPHRLGGVGEAAFHLRKELLARGHQVIVITAGKQPAEDGPGVHRVCRTLLWFPLIAFLEFPFFLKKWSFDVVHFHHSIAFPVLLWKHILSRRFPACVTTFQCARPYIVRSIRSLRIGGRVVARPTLVEYRTKCTFTLLRLADWYLSHASDMVTACSQDTRLQNIRVHSIRSDRIVAVHNAVNPDLFDQTIDGQDLRRRFGVNREETLISYVGGFSIRKRVPLVLHIVAEMRKGNAGIKLMVVGSGKNSERQLTRIAVDLGIRESVIFTGFVRNSDLPEYYAASDVVVVPSEYEPFGIVVVEAMVMGKPVVASRIGGIDEIIEDGISGYLVDKDDINGFARIMNELAENAELRKRVGAAALLRAKNQFSWTLIADSYEKIYRAALARSAAGGH